MKSTPLKVLLVSRDQAMLLSLSKFFDLLGLVALQVSDPNQATAAAASEHADILILDSDLLAEGGRELCRAVCGGGMRSHVFTILLVADTVQRDEIVEALKLGIDDFLAKPIVLGELLARLRAAARGLEFERRVQTFLGTDSLLSLANAAAFRQAARAALARAESSKPVACVTLDLDFFHRLNYMYGKPEAEEALRSIAKLIEKACHPADLLAASGDDRFWILLDDRSETDAGQWAEQLRASLAETQIPLGAVSETVTASFGVAACVPETCSADELLARADEALQAAKRSGRNCVVLRTTLDDESNAWTNLGAPGKLFDRTLARDVMAPVTVVLRVDDPVAHAVALLARTGQPAIPVVDSNGKLAGLVASEDIVARAGQSPHPERVADVMTADPVRFDEQATFAKLVSFFSEFERSLAVVVTEGDKPTGIVTRTGLAALSEPLTLESFAPAEDFQPTSDYLLVPDA
jgi:two-component system cell cycle response regulator